ncbi:hypothetical protein, partial [Mesorhizobium sp. M7A.F.Ca.US.006.04.2.1]
KSRACPAFHFGALRWFMRPEKPGLPGFSFWCPTLVHATRKAGLARLFILVPYAGSCDQKSRACPAFHFGARR